MKTASELMDEVVQHPTLDHFLDRAPPFSDKDYADLIEGQRAARALFNIKQENRKVKKQGGQVDEG